MKGRIILCSTKRSQYALENDIRYELNSTLVLKLKQYLKAGSRKHETDVVSKWVANQPEAIQKQIRVFPFHSMVA
jgi:hypothetical protein